jgi:flavin reductase (DIM6/NTAB) family NADH-FMN oxidoreductase RutF
VVLAERRVAFRRIRGNLAPNMPSHNRTATDSQPAFSERQFRDTLAQFATGVTVVCARAEVGRYVGFTANSFSSVSLNPPLILWSLAVSSARLADTFATAERYSINVLAAGQMELALRFSRRPHAERFTSVPYRLGWSEAPLIDGCVAWLECRHYARHRAGDHLIFIGEVVTVERAPGQGLVFHGGGFAATAPLHK